MENMKPKKSIRYRLSNMNIATVGIVDTPAVQGSEFIIAKRVERLPEGGTETVKLHKAALTAVRRLIKAGDVSTASWAFSGKDGDKILGEDSDWAAFSKVHLAVGDTDVEKREAYAYPVAKMVNGKLVVFRKAVIDAKSKAATEKNTEVEKAADALLQLIDAEEEPPKEKEEPAKVVAKQDPPETESGLSMNQQRCLYYAMSGLEGANFPYYCDSSSEPETWPPAVMSIISSMRGLLGDLVAKNLKKQFQEEAEVVMGNLKDLIKQARAEFKAGRVELEKAGAKYSASTKGKLNKVRDSMGTAMEHLQTGVGHVTDMLDTGDDKAVAKSDLAEMKAVIGDATGLITEMKKALELSPEERREWRREVALEEARAAEVEYLADATDEEEVAKALDKYSPEVRDEMLEEIGDLIKRRERRAA